MRKTSVSRQVHCLRTLCGSRGPDQDRPSLAIPVRKMSYLLHSVLHPARLRQREIRRKGTVTDWCKDPSLVTWSFVPSSLSWSRTKLYVFFSHCGHFARTWGRARLEWWFSYFLWSVSRNRLMRCFGRRQGPTEHHTPQKSGSQQVGRPIYSIRVWGSRWLTGYVQTVSINSCPIYLLRRGR